MSNWLVRYRFWLLGISIVAAMACGVMMMHVNINTDMTKYLPASSPMKAGLDILQDELGMSTNMASSGIRVMTQGQTADEQVDMRYQLLQMDEVESVTIQESEPYTLYELGVASSIDQVMLGSKIKQDYPKVVAAESPQDGTQADSGMLIGALTLLLIVLAAMCSSWLEPVLFLASTGIAVLLNMGTNAFLPSVSATTHSLASILQLVLSMDYSIILINRYRQERLTAADSPSAMNQAIRRAAPSVLSSALTTMVGLMMLVFMKLRIGADLGIVLSKGVCFSLVCNFTVLPALILMCENGIERTRKKVLNLPTDHISDFCQRYHIPLAIFFVILLAGSYWLHNQTPIAFFNEQPSEINKIFPKKNPVVLIYDNADEQQVAALTDSLAALPGVEMAISYPSIMLKEYEIPQMMAAIQDMAGMVNGIEDNQMQLPLDMVSEDVLRLVYFASKGERIETMDFETLINFIITQSKDPSSFLASQMSSDMKQKMAMYEDFRQMDRLIPDSESDTLEVPESIAVEETVVPTHPTSELANLTLDTDTKSESADTAKTYSPFADTTLITKPLPHHQMAAFLGFKESQAKMVYRLAKRADQQMSPVEFVHFLTDDILQRKSLASMISTDQRQQLLALRQIMDEAFVPTAAPEHKSPELDTLTTNKISHNTPLLAEDKKPAIEEPIEPIVESEDPLTILDELMSGHRLYTTTQMAQNFSAMGEPVNPALMELLYLYYGGQKRFNPQWKMSLSGMISFLADTLAADPRFSLFITPEMQQSIADGRKMMEEKISMMRSERHSAAIVVTNLATESDATYQFMERFEHLCRTMLPHTHYAVGESVMMSEMKAGFSSEMLLVTMLTIIAILIIVAFSFRSILIALLLVSTVMTGVFVDVAVSAIGGGSLLYMAYLIVQSILMGAAIDYGILFVNYYREKRQTLAIAESMREAFRSSIHTILTSGLILILVPGAMAILVADPTVASIVRAISVGALTTVLLVLFVLPGMLATLDRFIIPKEQHKG